MHVVPSKSKGSSTHAPHRLSYNKVQINHGFWRSERKVLVSLKEQTKVEDASASTTDKKEGQIKMKMSNFTVFGLEPTPELIAISMVYFVQGILGLSRLAVSFFFKDELGVEPAQVAFITGLAAVPWMIKPLYGFISDTIPLFGYRRRSYLLLSGFAGAVSWSALALWVDSVPAAAAMMILGSLSTAVSDVIVDSIVVERSRGQPQAVSGSLQSLCWASAAVGGIASAYFSGSLVQDFGCRTVFGVTALFPLIVAGSTLMIDERRVDSRSTRAPLKALPELLGNQAAILWRAVTQKEILLPTIFVFLWQATPSADTAMFYFQTNELHFTPEFLGRVRLAASLASLAGIAAYNTVLKEVALQKIFLSTMVLGTLLGSTQLLLISGVNRELGISDQAFVLGDSVLLTTLGQIAFMPVMVLAARLCPDGVEATLFATLMSIINAGSFVGSAMGGVLTSAFGVTSTDFTHLLPLYTLCNFMLLLPAPFLGLLPKEVKTERKSSDDVEENDADKIK